MSETKEAFLAIEFTEAAKEAKKYWPSEGVRFPGFSMPMTGDMLKLDGYDGELIVKKRTFSIAQTGQAKIQFLIDVAPQP